jgi:hypothetical protein
MITKNNFFSSYNDYSQFLYGIILSIGILWFKINIQTLILVFIVISYCCFDAFGRRITIRENKVEYRFIFFIYHYTLDEINYAKFNSGLYGHPTLFLYLNKKNVDWWDILNMKIRRI